MIAHAIGQSLRNRAVAERVEVEHGDHAGEGADREVAELVGGREREALLGGVAVGGDGERRDQVAEELESVGLSVDVGDLVSDVVAENVQKTCEKEGRSKSTGNDHTDDTVEWLGCLYQL